MCQTVHIAAKLSIHDAGKTSTIRMDSAISAKHMQSRDCSCELLDRMNGFTADMQGPSAKSGAFKAINQRMQRSTGGSQTINPHVQRHEAVSNDHETGCTQFSKNHGPHALTNPGVNVIEAPFDDALPERWLTS